MALIVVVVVVECGVKVPRTYNAMLLSSKLWCAIWIEERKM